MTSKNDDAWIKLFDKHSILEHIDQNGFYEISASEIKKVREPRLMTKFDHSSNRPEIFKKNKLSILPITRGKYTILKFDAYQKIDEESFLKNSPIMMTKPNFLESIDFDNITSEAIAINVAYISGIFHHFINDDDLYSTISGRMSSGEFEFKAVSAEKSFDVIVNNSQIEIDAGFEGQKSVSLVEAKNSLCEDFLIRQVYYPYRLWDKKLDKPINNIFMMYSNGIFKLLKYSFADKNDYKSIFLEKSSSYMFEVESITFVDIRFLLSNIEVSNSKLFCPFPQADDFDRVINLCEIIRNKDSKIDKEFITCHYDFDPRQTDYYLNACKYLGLIIFSKKEQSFILTNKTKEIFTMDIRKRNLFFIESILENEVFNSVLIKFLEEIEVVSIKEIIQIMKNSDECAKYGSSTIERRATTVSSWINWILSKIDDE